MDSERDFGVVIRKNIVPIALASVGLILIIAGIFQMIIARPKEPPLVFEESKVTNQDIVVDIEGAVIKPGVYRLSSESRIVDALAAAGGMSENADREWTEKNLNLAKKVSDGLKIYIPRLGEEILSGSSQESISVMNINTASSTDLESLPGIGAVTASNIIDSRPFSQIDDLLTRKIVGQSTFDKIKDKISAN